MHPNKPFSLLLLGLCFLLCSCAPKERPTIRIGINAWPGYEFIYLAKQKDFFEQEGVNVKVVEFNSLSDALGAYNGGQVDGLGCTLIELLLAREFAPIPPRAIIAVDYSNGADVVLSQRSISSLAQLKGKRVGVELGSLGAYMLDRVIEKGGLSYEDIDVVSSDQLTMERRFLAKELDAVISYPPVSLRLGRALETPPLFSSAEIPNELIDVVILQKELLDRYPECARGIRNAYFKAIAYAEDHPAEAYTLMSRREGITPEEFEGSLKEGIEMISHSRQRDFLDRGGLVSEALRRAQRTLLRGKQISNSVDPDELVWLP